MLNRFRETASGQAGQHQPESAERGEKHGGCVEDSEWRQNQRSTVQD